jgi:hypothetical protein
MIFRREPAMKHLVVRRFQFVAIVGFATLFFVSEISHAAGNPCDGLIKGLLENVGSCPDGKCNYNVVDGQIFAVNGGKANKGDGFSEMRQLSSAGDRNHGVSDVRITKGTNGMIELKFVDADKQGAQTKSAFKFQVQGSNCIHEETERKNPTNLAMTVDYDRDFCDVAVHAYDGLTDQQSATCDDALKKLVGKYDERLQALAKAGKSFRSASYDQKIDGLVMKRQKAESVQGQAQMIQALKQKDLCANATAEVNDARPKSFMERLGSGRKLLEPNFGEMVIIDKRAWPLKNFDLNANGIKK